MSLVLKYILTALLHLAFFASYPETGPLGRYYLAVSLLVWIVFITFVNTSSKLIKLFSGALGLALNLAVFALIALSLAATMPQRDKTSVLEKLRAERYPDRATLRAGMLRFGIDTDTALRTGIKDLGAEAGKALKKVKED